MCDRVAGGWTIQRVAQGEEEEEVSSFYDLVDQCMNRPGSLHRSWIFPHYIYTDATEAIIEVAFEKAIVSMPLIYNTFHPLDILPLVSTWDTKAEQF